MEVRKEIIPQGNHVYIDEKTGQPRVLPVTAATIQYYHDTGNQMLAAGLKIPVPLEHQPTARPMSAADYAANLVLNNAGEVRRFEVDNGRLFGILDITKPDALAGVKQGSIRWCSPHVSSFVDGAGKAWNGVIGHVALVTRPRIHKQSPFAETGAALSLAGMSKKDLMQPWDPAKIPASGITLTKAGLLKDENGVLSPMYPAAFSLAFGAKLSEEEIENLAKKESTEDEDGDGTPDVLEDDDDEKKPDGMGVPEAAADQDGDSHLQEVIFHLLDVMGIPVPPHPGKSFVRNLYDSLMRGVKEMATPEPEPVPVEDPNKVAPAPTNPIIQESPAMQYSLANLSLEVIAKIVDPEKKQLASALFSMQQQTAGLLKDKLDEAARKRQARIDRIARRLPMQKRELLLARVSGSGAQLSINAGQVVDPTDAILAAYEDAMSSQPDWQADAEVYANLSVPQHPIDAGGPMTDARRNEVMAEVARNTGGLPAVK